MTLADGLTADVCPADGAVLYHEFKNFIGTQALLTVVTDNKEEIPFGSEVTLYEGDEVREQTVTDEGGMVYFTAVPPESKIQIRWRSQDEIKVCQGLLSVNQQNYATDDLYRGELLCNVEKVEGDSGSSKGDEP